MSELYSRVIRQATHDAVVAVLSAPPDSSAGSAALRAVLSWVAMQHGPVAVRDLAEELAVDLAEALGAIASVEGRDPMVVADGWFHDVPEPTGDDPTD